LLLHLIAICGESKSKSILNSCKKLFSRIQSDSDCIYISIGWLLFSFLVALLNLLLESHMKI